MKRVRNQFTLGSLMILVATAALALAVVQEPKVVFGVWVPLILFFLFMFAVGLGIGVVGWKLAFLGGRFLEARSLESRKALFEPRLDPSTKQ